MDYKTAKTYENWTRVGEPIKKAGRLYTKVQTKCGRCIDGIYPSRIENGKPVPYPVENGRCFQCGGTGTVTKEVRLYTEKERYAQDMRKAKDEKAKDEVRRNKWYADHGFGSHHKTFIYKYDDSFEKKEELKAAGFKFSRELLWHATDIPAGYEDKVFEVDADTIYDGDRMIATSDEIREMVDRNIISLKPIVEYFSEFQGEVGDRLRGISATLLSMKETSYSYMYEFEDEGGNFYTWFTNSEVNADIGGKVVLTGTVKRHNEWKGKKSTVLNRCVIKIA